MARALQGMGKVVQAANEEVHLSVAARRSGELMIQKPTPREPAPTEPVVKPPVPPMRKPQVSQTELDRERAEGEGMGTVSPPSKP